MTNTTIPTWPDRSRDKAGSRRTFPHAARSRSRLDHRRHRQLRLRLARPEAGREPELPGRGARGARQRGRHRFRRRDRQRAFLLSGERQIHPRCVVPGRGDGVQPDTTPPTSTGPPATRFGASAARILRSGRWSAKPTAPPPAPDSLHRIPTSEDVDSRAPVRSCASNPIPTPGARKFEINRDTGAIDDETYTTIPTSYVIQTVGAVPGKIALTLRRRPGSGMDARDPRHPQGQARQGDVLRHRRERGGQPRPDRAHHRRGS